MSPPTHTLTVNKANSKHNKSLVTGSRSLLSLAEQDVLHYPFFFIKKTIYAVSPFKICLKIQIFPAIICFP